MTGIEFSLGSGKLSDDERQGRSENNAAGKVGSDGGVYSRVGPEE